MNRRPVLAAVALVALAGASHLPAQAAKAKPKPLTRTYAMSLAPVPNPPMGDTCTDPRLEGVAMHTETVKTSGAGTLTAKVNGFAGDWDISITSPEGELLGVGDGTTTGGGAPAQKGEDTVALSFKKATTFNVRMCNFAGTPSATGTFTFTYK